MQRVEAQGEARAWLRMNMEPEEKMEVRGWLQLGHWGLSPENGNQQRWLDEIKNIQAARPKTSVLFQMSAPPYNPSKVEGVSPSGHLIL